MDRNAKFQTEIDELIEQLNILRPKVALLDESAFSELRSRISDTTQDVDAYLVYAGITH